MTVIVTSVGSAPAIAVIKALRRSHSPRIAIVGVDCDPAAVGFPLCDFRYRVPRAQDRSFIARIKGIASKHGVRAIFPVIEEELPAFAAARAEFARSGIALIINRRRTLDLCFDKLGLYRYLEREGIKVPAFFSSADLTRLSRDIPVVLKRRIGRRTQDVIMADTRGDILKAIGAGGHEMVGQVRIKGREYTAEAVCDPRGKLLGSVIRERLQVRSGICVKARFVKHRGIAAQLRRLTRLLRVAGPFNAQYMETAGGELYLIDANPKFPGGGGLTLKAGVNIPLMMLEMALSPGCRAGRADYKDGLVVGSYPEEIVIGDAGCGH